MIVSSFFNTSTVRTGLGSFAGFANYAEMLAGADFLVVALAHAAVHAVHDAAGSSSWRSCSPC